MGRKKSLPDHSKHTYKIDWVFSDGCIKYLRKEFMFNNEFPLCEKLENAVGDYILHKNSFSDTPPKEQKVLLKEISKHTKLLCEVLKKIGLQEKADISIYLTNKHDNSALTADEFSTQVDIWHRAATKALTSVNNRTGKGGRPSGYLQHRLIRNLHEIYRDGTGRNDRITTYSDREFTHYGGKFYEFSESCFMELGVFESNSSLGKAIEKSLKTIPKTSVK